VVSADRSQARCSTTFNTGRCSTTLNTARCPTTFNTRCSSTISTCSTTSVDKPDGRT